jgi:hypothetical protein
MKTLLTMTFLLGIILTTLSQDKNDQLLKAVTDGDKGTVEKLIKEGADVNYIKEVGRWMKMNPLITSIVAHFLNEMKAIIIGLLTIFFLGDTVDVTQIKLNYYRTDDNQVWDNGIDELTIKTKGRILEKMLTDKNGLGTIKKDTIKKYKEIDIFLTSIGVEELYLKTINNSTIDRWEINIPRDYKMKLGRAICPKCNKADKVYKAIYGD